MKLDWLGIDKEMKVTAISIPSPVYGDESDSVKTIVKRMVDSGHRLLPIIKGNSELVGVVTYTDILSALLRGMTRNTQVSIFMTRDVIACDHDDTIKDALQKMVFSRRGTLPIRSGKILRGIVSERDFTKIIFGKHLSIPVSEVMTRKPFYITPGTTILNCMKSIINTHYRRLPVVENKEIVGIVTALDVLNYLDETGFNTLKLDDATSSIMKAPVFSVSQHDDLSDAIKIMIGNHIGGLPVIEEGLLAGIITERDVVELME
ncbi:MAG: CBS domain-containing protein [Candidatus Aenigmarchaeota archaeon]|nr:CBS domain-containing protein [Candidatus Aenigmarchaeota archaeon]